MNNIDKIYLVKTFHIKNNNDYIFSTDGIYINLEEALEMVKCNNLDLSENGYNNYAVVGAIEFGTYQILDEIQWFKWDKEQYVECDRPDIFNYSAFTF